MLSSSIWPNHFTHFEALPGLWTTNIPECSSLPKKSCLPVFCLPLPLPLPLDGETLPLPRAKEAPLLEGSLRIPEVRQAVTCVF